MNKNRSPRLTAMNQVSIKHNAIFHVLAGPNTNACTRAHFRTERSSITDHSTLSDNGRTTQTRLPSDHTAVKICISSHV